MDLRWIARLAVDRLRSERDHLAPRSRSPPTRSAIYGDGGRAAFDRGSPIERAYRDVRAAKFHPLDPALTLVHAGRVALGLPADRPQEWVL